MSTPSPSPDAGRVRFRKLRIAWSVFWACLCMFLIGLSQWALLAAFAVVAAVPWLPARFSLRTLLIVTTLVAVVLGLIVWQVRQ
jgi:hypothetical protein